MHKTNSPVSKHIPLTTIISLSKLDWGSVHSTERLKLRKGMSFHISLLFVVVTGHGLRFVFPVSKRINSKYNFQQFDWNFDRLWLVNCFRILDFSRDCNAFKVFIDRNSLIFGVIEILNPSSSSLILLFELINRVKNRYMRNGLRKYFLKDLFSHNLLWLWIVKIVAQIRTEKDYLMLMQL